MSVSQASNIERLFEGSGIDAVIVMRLVDVDRQGASNENLVWSSQSANIDPMSIGHVTDPTTNLVAASAVDEGLIRSS